MAKKSGKPPAKTKHHNAATGHVTEQKKVGSDRSAAEHFAGEHDFGIPAEGAGRFVDAAQEAKYQPGGDHRSDPRPPRSGGQGTRESGVGGVASGPGSSSGGDLDTDLVGVGTHGIGISAAGPDDAAVGEISQGEAAGDDNTEIDNIS
jgi:hypothetical protein